MITSLMDQMRRETAEELGAAIVAAIVAARTTHGIDDPEFPAVVVAAVGAALDRAGLCGTPAAMALGRLLVDGWKA